MDRTFQNRKAFLDHCRAANKAFFEANPRSVVVEYIRDPLSYLEIAFGHESRGKPNAVMVAIRNLDDSVNFGWAAVRPGEVFVKAEGLWRSLRRANRTSRPKMNLPHRIEDNALRFLDRAKQEFEKMNTPATS